MQKRVLANDEPEKAYQDNYHGHPQYGIIYKSLIFIMLVTILPDMINRIFGEKILPAGTILILSIFLLSLIKANLVLKNFMHVRFEPAMLLVTVFTGIFSLLLLFSLLWPDVTRLYDPNSQATYETQVIGQKTYIVNHKTGEMTLFELQRIKEQLGH